MTKKICSEIMYDAWQATMQNRRLMWYGFLPSLFGILFGIFYTIYQYTVFKVQYEDNFLSNNHFYHQISSFIFSDTWHVLFFAFLSGMIFLAFISLPPICHGSLTALLAKIRSGKSIRIRDGLSHGLTSFLSLIEYNAITSPLSVFTTIFMSSNIIRNFGWESYQKFLPVIILILVVNFILSLFFTYADFFIVLKQKGPFEAIGESCKLVIFYWEETFLIALFMFLIGIRVIINILVAVGIPALIIFVGSLVFASEMSMFLTVALAGLLGFSILLISSWANGILVIFMTAVWTFTLMRADIEKKDTPLLVD